VTRFRGGLVVEAHRLVYHSTLGSRVLKKRRKDVHQELQHEVASWDPFDLEELGIANGFSAIIEVR
jgi:hypothetical protein